MPRFSKRAMLDYIYSEIEELQKEFYLEPGKGSDQIKNDAYPRIIGYGRWVELKRLRDLIEGDYIQS